ncbi:MULTISPECIES: GntR family transcriptional regulator [Streptomyces]|uniref:GntR family transcriptional regulator n=2 Tax=Streptomyces TaxID=1883 RepID=A0ABV9J7G7_9ACTN
MNQLDRENDAAAGQGGGPPSSNPTDRPEQKAPSPTPDTVPAWQRPLQGLPTYPRQALITGSDKERYRTAIAKAYKAKGSIRDISAFIGRSFGWVNKQLCEAGVVMRSRGGYRHVSGIERGKMSTHVEKALRDRITDGTYEIGTRIPGSVSLGKEFGTSDRTVRAAMGRLEAAGLLLSVPGRGTVVTDPQNPPAGPNLRVRTGPGQWETWTIQEQSRTNYGRIRTVIIARIADGTYPPGHSIPSRTELTEELGARYSSIHRSLKRLEERGLLVPHKDRTGRMCVPRQNVLDAALKAGSR